VSEAIAAKLPKACSAFRSKCVACARCAIRGARIGLGDVSGIRSNDGLPRLESEKAAWWIGSVSPGFSLAEVTAGRQPDCRFAQEYPDDKFPGLIRT
jgi:hypothetical protein